MNPVYSYRLFHSHDEKEARWYKIYIDDMYLPAGEAIILLKDNMAKSLKSPNLKVGDVVVLKSGGVPMTVLRVSTHDRVCCGWFDNDGIYNSADGFPAAAFRVREE